MRCNIPSRDLSQKLNQSVCMYNGKPVWTTVDGGQIYICDLPNQDNRRPIKASDEAFDISSPPLGYVNYKNKVYYLSRAAVRRSRQALDMRSLSVMSLGQTGTNRSTRKAALPEHIVFSPSFYDMITENYKSLDDSIKELRGKHEKIPNEEFEIAVMRNIALQINSLGIINVFYKNDLVGWIAPNGNTVNVPSNQKGWIVSRFLSHVLNWRVK